nr:CPXV051A protein [Ipomoea batatas]
MHAKSQCKPSSREINSFERRTTPASNRAFFSQNIAQKLPEKKIPSTQAKANKRSANDSEPSIQRRAHLAFFSTQGTVSIAWEQPILLFRILDVSLQQKTVHLRVDILDGDLESIKNARASAIWTSLHEPSGKILQDDAVGGGKKRQICGYSIGEHTEPVRIGGEERLFWNRRHLFFSEIESRGGLDESIQLFVPYKTMTAEEAAALKADALPVPTSLCLRHWCRN